MILIKIKGEKSYQQLISGLPYFTNLNKEIRQKRTQQPIPLLCPLPTG